MLVFLGLDVHAIGVVGADFVQRDHVRGNQTQKNQGDITDCP